MLYAGYVATKNVYKAIEMCNQYKLRHVRDEGEKWSYPLRSSACATQRALYRVFSRDPEVIPYRLPILLIKESRMSQNSI
jgi:hypothetical protein